MGVAGFRVDAAKHVPSDDLKAIYYGLNDVNSDVGSGKPFIFNEVIDYGSGNPAGTRGEDYYREAGRYFVCN